MSLLRDQGCGMIQRQYIHTYIYITTKSRIICRNPNPVLSSVITYHIACKKSNTTGASRGAGTIYPSGVHLFVVFVDHCLSFDHYVTTRSIPFLNQTSSELPHVEQKLLIFKNKWDHPLFQWINVYRIPNGQSEMDKPGKLAS